MKIRVLDVETTGLTAEDAVCEVGWCDVLKDADQWVVAGPASSLINPERPIDIGAMAAHHITDAMVASAPTLINYLSQNCVLDPEIEVFAAFKSDFDSMFITITPPQQWVCVYKCMVRLAPQAQRYSNQYLRYWLKVDADDRADPAHRAGPDAYVTALILARMLARHPVELLLRISREPVVLPRFTFGKHKMVPLTDVPTDYLEWLTTKATDVESDVISTARFHLSARGVKAQTGIESVSS